MQPVRAKKTHHKTTKTASEKSTNRKSTTAKNKETEMILNGLTNNLNKPVDVTNDKKEKGKDEENE